MLLSLMCVGGGQNCLRSHDFSREIKILREQQKLRHLPDAQGNHH